MADKKRILNVSVNGAVLMTRHAILQQRGYEVKSVSTWEEFEHACVVGDFDLLILGQSLPPADKHRMLDYMEKHCPQTKVTELYLHAPSLELPAKRTLNAGGPMPQSLFDFLDNVLGAA